MPASIQGAEHSGSCICIDLHKFAYLCAKKAAGREEQKDSRVSLFKKQTNKKLISLKHFII